MSFFLVSYVKTVIFSVGWKILLTSRNEGVALRADPKCFTFKPNCLTLDECWYIFRRIAFPRSDTAREFLTKTTSEYSFFQVKKQYDVFCLV